MLVNNLRSLREARGYSQREFADAVGVRSVGAVSMWETGERTPRAALLPKIADVLGCTIDELLRGGGEKGGEG